MKKSLEKSLKLDIKPVFQFSNADRERQNFSDPTTITTVTVTTVANKIER